MKERFRGLAGSVAYSYFVKLDQVGRFELRFFASFFKEEEKG